MVLRVIEGDQTRAARAGAGSRAKARTVSAERRQRELRDRTLLETYLSVEDIERLRDQRLEMLVAQHRVDRADHRSTCAERQSRLETQIARFKPATTKSWAPHRCRTISPKRWSTP